MRDWLNRAGWFFLAGLIVYQTVQVHQARAESAAERAARDSTVAETQRQIADLDAKLDRAGQEIRRLEYQTARLVEQQEADRETTDEKFDRLREEVPARVLPLVEQAAERVAQERLSTDRLIASKDSIIALERQRTADADAKYRLAVAAAEAERRLVEELQEQVDAQAGSSLPLGLDVGDAASGIIGFLAGRASR